MVKAAEVHAGEDRKFRDLVEARNRADHLIHQAQHSLEGSSESVAAHIEGAISSLESVMKGNNKAEIEAKTRELAGWIGEFAESKSARGAASDRETGSQSQRG